jgi:ankyrin repeat protein
MPLLWAAYQGHLDVAQVLVDSGAALSATDKARARTCCDRSAHARRAGTPSSAARDAARAWHAAGTRGRLRGALCVR